MWEDIVPFEHFDLLAESELRGRSPRYAATPAMLHPSVQRLLNSSTQSLFSHQASALSGFLAGHDICLATSTASGKSRMFMAAAAHTILSERGSTCLALYPAKALIMDQLKRWKRWGKELGFDVGHIHGDVDASSRIEIMRTSSVVLMTPDVAHAWMLSGIATKEIRNFLDRLKVLVLDEAHVYQGAFGSNMAYFMRRLQAVAKGFQLIMTTATLGQPAEFAKQLTGRDVVVLTSEDDGSEIQDKHLAVISPSTSDAFQCKVNLLKHISNCSKGRFLAFADSRRAVEQIVAAIHRESVADEDTSQTEATGVDDDVEDTDADYPRGILPYRAGYEDHDRQKIQASLSSGELRGVVSTSALELGLDIGEIDVVVMLSIPPSIKSFWQRMGRAGRRDVGKCVIVDSGNVIQSVYGGLDSYLSQEMEPNWLYLDNKKIQYTNALCAAREIADTAIVLDENGPFASLPQRFRDYLLNEMEPTQAVENELLGLKQRAEGGPHREFPIRSGIEPQFSIKNRQQPFPLGHVTFTQSLREAYPGAIYYYMAKAYRVYQYKLKAGEIIVRREKRWQTTPVSRTKVFPDLINGNRQILRSTDGFITESELQVSEQLLGFRERRGRNETTHDYNLASPYWTKPLTRYFRTTGVCWSFPSDRVRLPSVGEAILRAYSVKFGIDSRDLGCGAFHAKASPFGKGDAKGMAIFDATDGSLRLTQYLASHFAEVLEAAIPLLSDGEVRLDCPVEYIDELLRYARELEPAHQPGAATSDGGTEEWQVVIARGQQAMYVSNGAGQLVEVITYFYTPSGLKYRLKSNTSGANLSVDAGALQPLNGETQFMRVNLETGEEEAI